ncbi:MAG: esterase-like activity of phytase family protein [Pseudomonadota bacterium]
MNRRVLPVLLLSVALAPGTWLRSPIIDGFDKEITLRAVDERGEKPPAGWALEGVWEYEGEGRFFGGFSALIALADGKLRAFSDRGARFTLVEPDRPQQPYLSGNRMRPPRLLGYQLVEKAYSRLLWDIESATRDPETGQYWLGFEYTHGFHRFTRASEQDGVRVVADEVRWASNSGAEAMVRVRDGRFVVIPESGREVLVYPGDPVEGEAPQTGTYASPRSGFAITAMRELPDGRLLLLLRAVSWTLPPFDARLAIADMPPPGEPVMLAPQIVLDLSAIAPRDNYEGLALRERGDGTLDAWVISDDNFAMLQRTLLVKLRLDPTLLAPLAPPSLGEVASGAGQPATPARKKARE